MKFSIYILLAATLLWFVFASVFFMRSHWDRDKATIYHSGILTEHAVAFRNRKVPQNILAFKVQGLNQKFGIHRKKEVSYEKYLKKMHIGDTIHLWFSEWRVPTNDVNFQIVHMESGKETIVNIAERQQRDRIIALILYVLCLLTMVTAWVLNRRYRKSFYRQAALIVPFT